MSLMSDNPVLPSNLWPLRDAIIEHAHGKARKPRNLKRLHDWLEDDGWDSLVGESSKYEMAIKLYDLAYQQFSDSEFRAVEGLNPGDVITDDRRLTYARELISAACSGDDGYLCPTLHSYKLERQDGASAIVGALVEIHGQGGAVAVWQGIYATREDFFAAMKRCDVWLIEDVKEIDDARILALWERDI